MDCPHYPGLKAPSVQDWLRGDVPPKYPHAYQVAMTRPEDCVQCAMERIKKLGDALNETIALASQLLRTPVTSETREAAGETLTRALRVFYDDKKNWMRP